jgi:hypothetical protein
MITKKQGGRAQEKAHKGQVKGTKNLGIGDGEMFEFGIGIVEDRKKESENRNYLNSEFGSWSIRS